ncbi:response regulator [Sulfurimonas sp.]|nr:response regulator [Sulfurimonas sp.]
MNINGMKILSICNKDELPVLERYAKSLSLDIDSFEDSKDALESCQGVQYDLVVVDDVDFIRALRHDYADVPIIMLVIEEEIKLQEKALKFGAHDILSKPISPILFQSKIQNALRLKKSEALLKDQSILLADEVNTATKELQASEHEVLQMMGVLASYKEHEGSRYSLRMAHYCQAMAKLAGLNEKVQDIAFHASQVYDLGKSAIPDEILLRNGKLNEDETEIMKTHARKGYDILKYAQSKYLKAGAVISYSHHEKYDGTGYPIGLKGETIPILGRIVSLVHVFDALTSVRTYRDVWSLDDACKYLEDEKGKSFDPSLVDLFLGNLDAMMSIKSEFN